LLNTIVFVVKGGLNVTLYKLNYSFCHHFYWKVSLSSLLLKKFQFS